MRASACQSGQNRLHKCYPCPKPVKRSPGFETRATNPRRLPSKTASRRRSGRSPDRARSSILAKNPALKAGMRPGRGSLGFETRATLPWRLPSKTASRRCSGRSPDRARSATSTKNPALKTGMRPGGGSLGFESRATTPRRLPSKTVSRRRSGRSPDRARSSILAKNPALKTGMRPGIGSLGFETRATTPRRLPSKTVSRRRSGRSPDRARSSTSTKNPALNAGLPGSSSESPEP